MSQQTSKLGLSLLRGLAMGSVAALLAWPLTVASGVASALFGGLLAVPAAELAARSRARSGSVLLLTAVFSLLGVGLARALVASSTAGTVLGPIGTLRVSEALLWAFLAAPVTFALRFAAARAPALAALEVLAVGGALAASLAAHREGRINRPFEIGDWAWSRGLDPALVFLVLGGLASLLLAALLLRERQRRRVPLHFSVLFAIALLLILLVRVGGLPAPRTAGDLGLTGDPAAQAEAEARDQREGSRGGQRGGEGQGKPSDELDEMEFKDEYSSQGNEAPVAVVVLRDDYSPPSGVYYFRQTVFSQYNGRRLVQATRGDVDRDILRFFPANPYPVPDAPAVSAERTALGTTVGLMIDHVRPFALDSPALVRPTANPNPMRFQRAFDVVSHVQTLPYREMLGRAAGAEDWSEEVWAHYTEAPRDPRYAELAATAVEVLRDKYRTDPLAQALAVKGYLDKNGIYSRRSSHAGAEDPTASFLFGDLTGYCVHFAHAATYLLRSRGVPARVAAGYALSESNRAGGSAMLIRGQDAHAWPEVYLRGVGWVVVDLTPEQVLDAPSTAPDAALQRILGEMMRQSPEQQAWQDANRQHWPRLAEVLRALGWALAAVLLLAYGVKLYRRLVPLLARRAQLYRLSYRTALDRLAEVGVRRGHGESRESFARRGAVLAPSFAPLTGEHLGWALGSRRSAPPEQVGRLAAEVGAELRRSVPGWRRLLGWLHPFSWLQAR